jgi:hypothetical protein
MPEKDMIDLASLESKTLAPLVGQAMTLRSGDQSAALEVTAVTVHNQKYPSSNREPFTISFKGQPGLRIPQATYTLEHPELGTLEIFVTQTGDGPSGSEFESIFT